MKVARHFLPVALLLSLHLGLRWPSVSVGAEFSSDAVPLLREYCFDCHATDAAEAEIDLEQMAAARDFGRGFGDWERVLGMVRERRMPPADVPRPSAAQREVIAAAVQGELDRFIREHAGDPGSVMVRRLTSAEYAYTIGDLTGLDLDLDAGFVSDAVGGAGFTNVGTAQFMQDSTLERHLEAARQVAAHAVIGSGPLEFFADPGRTGFELSAIQRILEIYRSHGFRTGAGEGAEPFGLDRYPKAFYAAWRFKHRLALGTPAATLAALAAAEGIHARFVAHIWQVVNEQASFPTSAIVEQWRALPSPDLQPGGETGALEAKVRAQCERLYATLRDWQSTLAASAGDEEEAAVLTEGDVTGSPTHSFRATVNWPRGASTAEVELTVARATHADDSSTVVIWKDPQIRFRGRDRRQRRFGQPLREVLSAESLERLAFGRHPLGAPLDPRDFALQMPASVTLVLELPDSAAGAQLTVDVELDRGRGPAAPVRCTISDGAVDGETAAERGAYSALLVDPQSPLFDAWKQGVIDFATRLPEVSQREPAPSDRDPIPAPFENTYNTTERNWFHYYIKYHRDDRFLVEHMLDDATRERLDQAWADLLSSFEYHDANLGFVADKYRLELTSRHIADLDDATIATLPEEPGHFIRRLRESYVAIQQRLEAAQPGHVEDAIQFAERAWRRPLAESEAHRLRSYYAALRKAEELDHDEALRTLLARMLVAPAFLYRAESPGGQTGIVPLSSWELASRLSYFLWSSLPDAELRQAVSSGALERPEELGRQARRMLRDPRARRLATEFFGQWLGFYRFDEYRGIDPLRFPEFTGALKASMYEEAVSFFEHIVREDRPVDEILFADYSLINDQLAEHYGIERGGVGETHRLEQDVNRFQRGGVMGLGAVLTLTSAPLRTSAVRRGDWVLRRLLGTAVPPPPADAGSIPADDVGADGRTVRQRLEAHRREPACVNCHSRIDPLGFALEHYDAIGRWRDAYRDGRTIDASGTLRDGTRISGLDGLRGYLRREQPRFYRTLASRLMSYALGRSELASDRILIDEMLSGLESDNRFSSLLIPIVTSRQFRYQRGEQPPVETTAAALQETPHVDR